MPAENSSVEAMGQCIPSASNLIDGGDITTSRQVYKEATRPSQLKVHAALILGQALNGGGSVIARLGIPKMNPIFFAFMRESCATPLLAILAFAIDGRPNMCLSSRNCSLFFLGILGLFAGQVFWVTGIMLANPVVGSAWQPSQPIFVLIMAVLLGWERCSLLKTFGVFFALAGGAVMTFAGHGDAKSGSGDDQPLLGNLFFFLNCMGSSVLVVALRVICKEIPNTTALTVIYAGVTVCVAILAAVVSAYEGMQTFFCPGCTDPLWYFPSGAWFALGYWVLGTSVIAYICLSYGTKYASDATHCLAYCAVQPVVAGVLETVLVLVGVTGNETAPLQMLTLAQALGAAIVILGVACVGLDAKLGGNEGLYNCIRKDNQETLLQSHNVTIDACDSQRLDR